MLVDNLVGRITLPADSTQIVITQYNYATIDLKIIKEFYIQMGIMRKLMHICKSMMFIRVVL